MGFDFFLLPKFQFIAYLLLLYQYWVDCPSYKCQITVFFSRPFDEVLLTKFAVWPIFVLVNIITSLLGTHKLIVNVYLYMFINKYMEGTGSATIK